MMINVAAKLGKGDMGNFYPLGIIESDFASDAGQWDALGYFMQKIKEADPGTSLWYRRVHSQQHYVDLEHVHAYVTDVNAYPRLINDLLNIHNSRDLLRRHLCPLLGLWHIGKQMGTLIFRHYFTTITGPLLLALNPTNPAKTFSSFAMIGQLLMLININYDNVIEPLRSARANAAVNDIMRDHAHNTYDLVNVYVPIFVDFMIALKLNDWAITRKFLYRALVVLLSFDSALYTSGVGTYICHLRYLEMVKHPIMRLIEGSTERMNEECVEIANSWLSKATGNDSTRSDIPLLNREYTMQK
jgi:hypothetical protein